MKGIYNFDDIVMQNLWRKLDQFGVCSITCSLTLKLKIWTSMRLSLMLSLSKFQYVWIYVFSDETLTFRMNYNWQVSSKITKQRNVKRILRKSKNNCLSCAIFSALEIDSLNSCTFHCSFLIHLQIQTISRLRMDIFICKDSDYVTDKT